MTIQMRNNTPLQKGSAKVEVLIGKPNTDLKNILKFLEMPDEVLNFDRGIEGMKADPDSFGPGWNRW
jgi:hypothetical protein